ncbi:MAG: tyrosine-type recombinase/integrase [Candidatus Devosia phytovorans]|uniref:Tyrosine-type recombinase/integrase n=1 Tax=Candidatus Devosia phytovorans TaxID=3121372 RepID=A0AAJ6AZM9_9HYPH|nr:site-specific integrase [Devosia sp.]WEK04745.1 MAG: tyrosine-type recombinase/integrase [Devosia sp.]
MRITKRAIDGLMEHEPGAVLRDEDLKGFQARRTQNGITYAFEYRAGSGRLAPVRRMTIGKGGALTPDEARKEAKALSLEVAQGKDPAARKAKDKLTPTVADFATAWLDGAEQMALAQPEAATLRPRTIATYRSLLRRHVLPSFGNKRLDQVDGADVKRLFDKVKLAQPATANRCLEIVGSIYRNAASDLLVPRGTNPAAGIAANRERLRERFLSPAELASLGQAITKAETEGVPYEPPKRDSKRHKHVPKHRPPQRIDAGAAAALRLLIFTGARLREILHAEWANVDVASARLRVFGKTGWRYIVLPAPALEVIVAQPRVGRYVIGSSHPEKPKADLARPWAAVSKLAGLEGVRIHDLRHSFASVAVSGGASLPMIGALLGHTQAQTTKRYAHLADDALKAAADAVARQINIAEDARANSVRPLRAIP